MNLHNDNDDYDLHNHQDDYESEATLAKTGVPECQTGYPQSTLLSSSPITASLESIGHSMFNYSFQSVTTYDCYD